jgi:hypothetical protein
MGLGDESASSIVFDTTLPTQQVSGHICQTEADPWASCLHPSELNVLADSVAFANMLHAQPT